MKAIKILFACLFTVSLGVAVSAFNIGQKAEQPASFTNHWYEFVGDVSDIDQVTDASYYRYRESEPSCEEGELICSVYAPGPATTNANPSTFSPTLEGELASAFNGDPASGNIKMKDE